MDYINSVLKFYEVYASITKTSRNKKLFTKVNITGKLFTKNYMLFVIVSFLIALFIAIVNKKISVLYLVLFLIVVVAVFIRSRIIFTKYESKPKNLNIYNRDLPSNLRPAHVRMLLNDGLVDEVSIYVTLLDLIDKGYLQTEKKNRDDNNLRISVTNKNQDKLLEYEKFLINWFVKKYGNKVNVGMNEIHEALTNNKYAEQPYSLFLEWQGLLFLAFPFNKYYKKTNITSRTIFLLLTGISFFIGSYGILLAIYSVGCLLYAAPLNVLTDEAIEEIDSWKDLKRFLIDFSNIKDKNIEMVEIWDFYLTYALSLDIAETTKKEFDEFIEENVFNSFTEKVKNKEEIHLIPERLYLISKDEIKRMTEIELNKYNQ